jgi:hypothetical protein
MFADVNNREKTEQEQNRTYYVKMSCNWPQIVPTGNWRWLKVPNHEAICLPRNVPTCHIVDFSTSTICIRYQVLLAAYYKAGNGYTLILSFCFRLIMFYFMLFLFLFLLIQFFVALGNRPMCVVVKPAVCVCPFLCRFTLLIICFFMFMICCRSLSLFALVVVSCSACIADYWVPLSYTRQDDLK